MFGILTLLGLTVEATILLCVVVFIGGRSLGAGLFVSIDPGLQTWMTEVSVRAMCLSASVAKPNTLLISCDSCAGFLLCSYLMSQRIFLCS